MPSERSPLMSRRRNVDPEPEDEHAIQPVLRGHIVAFIGEFLGTTMFLFFAFAAQITAVTQAGTGDHLKHGHSGLSSQTILYIALGYGFSLLVNVWIFFRVSGGLFNPAVTLCLIATAQLPWLRGLILLPAQLIGGIIASLLINALLPSNPLSLVVTTPSLSTSHIRALFLEALLTLPLLLTILMLAAEKSRATFLAPLAVGLALFVAEIAGINYTGASLNPARSFGPSVVSGNWGAAHWVYWVGPGLGAVLAAGVFAVLKWLRYQEANPGQDTTGEEVAVGTERV